MGLMKLGHPQPASYLASDAKSSAPQQMQRYTPGVTIMSYSPVNGRSVAFCRVTAYCSGVNCLRHSLSPFLILSRIAVSPSIITKIIRRTAQLSARLAAAGPQYPRSRSVGTVSVTGRRDAVMLRSHMLD